MVIRRFLRLLEYQQTLNLLLLEYFYASPATLEFTMKKFYPKKDLPVEESPLTLQLQRRHTVVEGDKKDSSPVISKLRPVCRSNSTSSIYRPPKSAKDLSSQKGYLESTLSSESSAASTVVITECQLSSSWLYNNQKAQMKTLSPGKPSSQHASDNEEAISPIIPRPKVKSVSSANRSSKRCSSCCCYAAIVILGGLAVMGIISAIGGIVYMEFFSGSNKTLTRVSGQSAIGRSEDLSYTKNGGQSLDVVELHTSQDLTSREEISVSSPKSKQELEILNHLKDSNNNDDIGNKQSKGSGNILRVKKVKKDIVPTTEADASPSTQMTDEQQLQEGSNKKQKFHQVDVVSSSSKGDSPYSKLFELYKGIHNNLNQDPSSLNEPSSFEIDELNPKITDLKEDVSNFTENRTFELAHQVEIESDKHSRLLDVSFDSSDSSKESFQPDSGLNLEASLTPNEEDSQSAVPKYFFQRPSKDAITSLKNMFGINEGSDVDVKEEQPSVRTFLPLIPQVTDLNDDSNDNVSDKLEVINQDVSLDSKESFNVDSNLNENHIPSGEISGPLIPKNFLQRPSEDANVAFRNMFDSNEIIEAGKSEEPSFPRFLPHIPELSDKNDANDNVPIDLDVNNQELPLELNRPISETKIAVPGPLDLLRRFAMGTESDNKKNSEMEHHDRRFFLAQALERLRTLDVANILPSSRQKTDSKKNPKQKLEPKVQTEQEVITERSTYLQKLRRHFFEQ